MEGRRLAKSAEVRNMNTRTRLWGGGVILTLMEIPFNDVVSRRSGGQLAKTLVATISIIIFFSPPPPVFSVVYFQTMSPILEAHVSHLGILRFS